VLVKQAKRLFVIKLFVINKNIHRDSPRCFDRSGCTLVIGEAFYDGRADAGSRADRQNGSIPCEISIILSDMSCF